MSGAVSPAVAPDPGAHAFGKQAEVIKVGVAKFRMGFFSRTVPRLWDRTTGEKGQALDACGRGEGDRWREGVVALPESLACAGGCCCIAPARLQTRLHVRLPA